MHFANQISEILSFLFTVKCKSQTQLRSTSYPDVQFKCYNQIPITLDISNPLCNIFRSHGNFIHQTQAFALPSPAESIMKLYKPCMETNTVYFFENLNADNFK